MNVISNGIVLAGDAYGNPSSPPVLLLHGGGQTRHAWGDTATVLAARGWYAVSLDLRGHGDSGRSLQGDYSIDGFIADFHAILRTFREPPALIGASLGGWIGLVAEGEADSSLLLALVLVDVAHALEDDGLKRIFEFMRSAPDGFPSVEAAADAVAVFLPQRPRPGNLAGLRRNLRLGTDGRWRWHWDPEFMRSDRRPDTTSPPERLRAAAKRIRIPTLLVRGKISDVLSEAGAAEFLRLVPGARYADVSGAGHMVAGDNNSVFTDALIGFLDDVMNRRQAGGKR